MQKSVLTQKSLREILNYDPLSGEFRWLARPSRNVSPGKIAGYKNGCGYIYIQIEGNLYRAHRLVWLYVYGVWPRDQIDHINGIKTDNRLINLREATPSDNGKNSRTPTTNTSGFKGASYSKRSRSWKAQIKHHGKITHLGYFPTPEDAHSAYCEAALRIAGEFANDGKECIGVG